MHYWGDKNVDWKGIEDSAYEIGDFLKKWGRVNIRQCKEKFGQVRVYLTFGFESLHSITHPGYVYSQYPLWLSNIDNKIFSPIIQILNHIVIPYHMWLYKLAYKRAINKRFHLKEEILSGADYPELLTHLK